MALSPDSFELVELADHGFSVRVLKSSLKDQRGVGTMSRSLLQGFKKIGRKSVVKYPVVHLFPFFYDFPEKPLARSILIVHDITVMLAPEFIREATAYRTRLIKACNSALHIVTPSLATKSNLIRFIGIPESKITVIHNPITVEPQQAPAVRLPSDPFFAFTGSGNEYRNVPTLLKALALMENKDVQLVITGRGHETAPLAEKLGVGGRVHYLGHLPQGQSGYVISRSLGLLSPAAYEGFGLCPFEAALHDRPAVVLRIDPVNEVTKPDEVFWCETTEPEEWATVMDKLASGHSTTKMVSDFKSRIQTELSAEVISSKYADLFKRLFFE